MSYRKIPEKIFLGGHTIPITIRKLDGEDEGSYGYFDSGKLEIHIDNGPSNTMKWETFIHEVLEAVCFFTETPLPHPTIQSFGLLIAQALDSLCQEELGENGVGGV